MTSSEFT